MDPFIQPAPELADPWEGDGALRDLLAMALPEEVHRDLGPSLAAMGRTARDLQALSLVDRLNEPRHVPFDAWGQRIDRIEVTELWKQAERVAAEQGLVATAYEARHGALSRIHQAALIHLFHPSSDIYSCPLAMTDGAVRTLVRSGNKALIDRAVPHLTSRDPATFWTSGQWMTESAGGSDVGLSSTVARRGEDGVWRLHGRKWFTSAAASQMALTLARPVGNPEGGKGLAMFYVETRDAEGGLNGFTVNRLKDKLGTRKLPTAELDLDGMVALPVGELGEGVKAMASMLTVTRTWNAICAASTLRRGLMLLRDYGAKRVAFGAPLEAKPLHRDTVAGVEAEAQAAFQLAFHAAACLGLEETGQLDPALLRVITPLAKLCTGKQAVAGVSELLEGFGGAGYVEDTGLPVLLRDAQVFSIWEGTTDVLSLEALKALQALGIDAFADHVGSLLEGLPDRVDPMADRVRLAVGRAIQWWSAADEAGARRFALTLARSLELALLLKQAVWSAAQGRPGDPFAAARRFADHGVDLIRER